MIRWNWNRTAYLSYFKLSFAHVHSLCHGIHNITAKLDWTFCFSGNGVIGEAYSIVSVESILNENLLGGFIAPLLLLFLSGVGSPCYKSLP
jgi:hypothetical protein